MRPTITGLLGLIAAAAATPAFADEPTAPPPDFAVTGGATLVSDYRFRGISQTDRRFAIQGTFSVQHSSGLYATLWGSSIDDYVANGSDAEIDLIAGWRKTWGGTTFDGGFLYYYYPGSHGANTDFAEPYASIAETLGPVTAKLTANYAYAQHAISVRPGGRSDNLYLAGDLSAAVPQTPLTLTAHLGHTWGPSTLSIARDYTDWNLGASVTLHKNFVLGLQYVDTNRDLITPNGRNASGAGIVGSIGVSF